MNLYARPSFSKGSGMGLSGSLGAILLLWALVNGSFLLTKGMVTNGEAAKYIDQAHHFVSTGHPETANFWLYFLPIALLSLCLKFHLSFGWVIFFQLLVNLLATLTFFRTVSTLLHAPKAALAASILLLANFPYQAYNTFLQTESLFQSLTLLLSCYIISRKDFSFRSLAVIFLGLILLSLTRPNGLLYWPIACGYLIFLSRERIRLLPRLLFLGLSVAGFLVLLNTAMGSGGELDFMLPFREEHIICGTPTLLIPVSIQTEGSGNSLYSLFYYITHNPGQFVRLAVLKSASFWGLYRPYFSVRHNLFLMLYFYPMIILALLAIRKWWRDNRAPFLYLAGLILLTWLMVVLTCDDWHNRVFLGISPYLLFIGLPAWQKWLDKPRP
jgi:hypothetical protein